MALYLNENELVHRICNGFLTHDGYVDGKFYDIYKRNDINVEEIWAMEMLSCVMKIIKSMEDEGVQIYPKELRGRNIREIRKGQEKSVNCISLKTGLSRTTIYDIEYGLTKPRFSTLEKIAKALKVDIEALG